MGSLFSAADLVLSRAGAGTIAELMQCRAPSVLVPYPYATDNHQLANARFLEQLGGSLTIEQSQISGLYGEVIELIYNDWLLDKFRQNLQRLNLSNSAELIACDLEKLSSEFAKKDNGKEQ
jgi:UDP-N-acetylglucosamine--N-acetylmuramyl-(pentapeptide) pyrophosphoryl-undecaprenol N-acetylglucosamine transferase